MQKNEKKLGKARKNFDSNFRNFLEFWVFLEKYWVEIFREFFLDLGFFGVELGAERCDDSFAVSDLFRVRVILMIFLPGFCSTPALFRRSFSYELSWLRDLQAFSSLFLKY